ncbi:hypothetical protein Ahy_B07g086337 isoform E [Arachis hypogaea]|uniref:Aminotransferase-like plant mobile domain-containing protein n=1 Tax=Arachis hypogaea TaxID=3818 RepID=A0A444Y9M0_ARAHY|nr:hypothetical protein Ahy_B07g086337 isoform E [Arachis hypogaea]
MQPHRCIMSMRRHHGILLDDRIMLYLRMAGLAYLARLNDHWFRLDEPLVSPFVERWYPETYTFHLPFSECMIALQDLLGVLPPPDFINKFTVKCTWMQETFSDLPEGIDKETLMRYTRAYIMMLLSTQFFGVKFGARMHIRWLLYVARLEKMGRYSWGSATLSWLYRCLRRVANKHMVKLVGPLQLLQSWISWRFQGFRPDGSDASHWPLAMRYAIDYHLFFLLPFF